MHLKVKLFRVFLRLMSFFCWWRKVPQNVSVETKTLPVAGGEIRARVYTPLSEGPYPVIVYFHGGGFVIGSVEDYDPVCRALCERSGRLVVSVNYRLAPEHPFPCAPNDCLAAVEWVLANIDRLNGRADSIVLAGDSAGGNLATVTALRASDSLPGAIAGQVLVYPVTHHYSHDLPSYRDNGKGHGLTRNMMIWFWDHYYRDSELLQDGQTEHELATPLALADLSRLPPALVMTAELDPLRDEGVAYAERMAEQGVAVEHTQYPGLEHGFFGGLGPNEAFEQASDAVTAWLDRLDSQISA